MANLNIRVQDHKGNLRYNVWVRGRKMTDSYMKKHYGTDWRDTYESLYYCGKNKYGIVWVSFNKGRYGDYQDFCDDPSKAETPIKCGVCDKVFIFKD